MVHKIKKLSEKEIEKKLIKLAQKINFCYLIFFQKKQKKRALVKKVYLFFQSLPNSLFDIKKNRVTEKSTYLIGNFLNI